jgi:hypothetical protein
MARKERAAMSEIIPPKEGDIIGCPRCMTRRFKINKLTHEILEGVCLECGIEVSTEAPEYHQVQAHTWHNNEMSVTWNVGMAIEFAKAHSERVLLPRSFMQFAIDSNGENALEGTGAPVTPHNDPILLVTHPIFRVLIEAGKIEEKAGLPVYIIDGWHRLKRHLDEGTPCYGILLTREEELACRIKMS